MHGQLLFYYLILTPLGAQPNSLSSFCNNFVVAWDSIKVLSGIIVPVHVITPIIDLSWTLLYFIISMYLTVCPCPALYADN